MTARYPRWFIFVPILALLFAGVAAVAFALGESSGGPAARADQSTMIPGHPELGPGWHAPSTVGGVRGQVVLTIAKVDGSKLSLQTTNGRTQTIDATGVAITKGGRAIAVSDLEVGDRITFREVRQSDGTYKITAIQVLTSAPTPTPKATPAAHRASVLGTVASKTATSIVVTTTGGKTVTISVSSTTRYLVRGAAHPTLSDIAVGDRITAQGTLDSDGSLAATVVQVVPRSQPGGGRGSPIPKPSASASAPNT